MMSAASLLAQLRAERAGLGEDARDLRLATLPMPGLLG